MKEQQKTIIYGLLISALTFLFLFTQLDLAGKRFVDFDSAWHASMAKNIATGVGYASSYQELEFFDKAVTTGPSLILPLSVVISASGNSYELPYQFAIIFNSTMLLASLLLLNKSFDRKENWLAFSIIFTAFLFYFEPLWWIKFTADISVIFLCLLSVSLINYEKPYLIILAGVFFGLAFLAKIFAVFMFVAVMIYFLLVEKSFKRSLFFIAGLMIPVILWLAYKSGSPGEAAPFDQKLDFLLSHSAFGFGQYLEASSITQAMQKSVAISHKVLSLVLADYGLHYSVYILLLAANIFSASFSYIAIKKHHENFNAVFCWSLFSLFVWIWFELFCFSLSSKYTLFPLLISTSSLLLFLLASFGRFNFLAYALVIVFFVMLPKSLHTAAQQRLLMKTPLDPYKTAFLETKSFIESKDLKEPLATCGTHTAPWMMEYSLDTNLNFKDCYRELALSKEYSWQFILYMDKPLWLSKNEDTAKHQILVSYCERNKPVFDNNYYALLNCSVNIARFNEGKPKAAKAFKQASDK